MLLRDRPSKFCHGTSNWPSGGTGTDQLEKTHPKRKVPVLKSAIPSLIHSADRFFLCIDYEDLSYTDGLLFDDHALYHQTQNTFNFCCNHSIADIYLTSPLSTRIAIVE